MQQVVQGVRALLGVWVRLGLGVWVGVEVGGRRVAPAARLQDVEETLGGHGLCRGFPMLRLLLLVPLVLGTPVLEPHLHLRHGTVTSVRNRELDQEWWLTGTS